MVVGEVPSATDVLVIGGGPGGYVAALRCSEFGLKVTLVERGRIGGTCLNTGCIPSKGLIHAAESMALSAQSASWGVDIVARLEMCRLQEHLGNLVSGLTQGVSSLLVAAGVDVIHGVARFSLENRVAIECGDAVRHFEFRHAIVATGSRPVELSALPFGGKVLDSTGALALDELPESLTILGAGYIGVELGTAFAKLGAKVTIVEALDRVLPNMDPRFGRLVARRMGELGIDLRLGCRARSTTANGLEVESSAGVSEVVADRIVVAVGRCPNTDGLGLRRLGIEFDPEGRIVVDAARRASRHILAIGDVTAGPALAHKAMAEAEVAARTAAGQNSAFDPSCIPEIVFSDPEIASVGLTASMARKQGYEVLTGRFPLAASGRARTLSESDGFVEIVADRSDGTVLGVQMVGPRVSEMAGEASLAVEMGATLEDLMLTIHAHPTLSEGLPEAAMLALGRGLHVRSTH